MVYDILQNKVIIPIHKIIKGDVRFLVIKL